MESNPTTPTIAELWLEFEAHNEFIEERTFLLQQETDGDFDPYRESAAKDIVWRQGRIDALRAQLIERCAVVPDVDGFSSIFEIEERNGQLVISVYFQDRRGYSSRHPRCDDANTAKEYAAAYAFWVWELDQRQRESTSTAATTQQQP